MRGSSSAFVLSLEQYGRYETSSGIFLVGVCMRLCVGVCTFPHILSSPTLRSKPFRPQTYSINSIKMDLPGIEGFKNVYQVLEAVSSGDKFRLRRAARKIRLVLMCADNKTLNDEDRASLTALLGLLVTDWDEAEVCYYNRSTLHKH